MSYRQKIIKQNFRHYSRVLRGKNDPSWLFYQFERRIHPETWKQHDGCLHWALNCAEKAEALESRELYEASDDPIVRQGHSLAQNVKRKFKGRYKDEENLRILVHVPAARVSPGGYSLFNNLIESLDFLGIHVKGLEWDQAIEQHLREFKPTILLSSDHASYLSRINWYAVDEYRQQNSFRLGLSASLQEYGNTPLQDRLDWAGSHAVDFFYSFRTNEYLHERKEYRPFFERGYQVHSIEFGANPLHYYPVPSIKRDLNFVFLASSNQDKWLRYVDCLGAILERYSGIIDGPGWSRINEFSFNAGRDRYLYARAKVGINLHIENQLEWASELNERTYMLAACGVPQLVDEPKLLYHHFRKGSLFVAASPGEYVNLFQRILDDPAEARRRALEAQKDVFEKHTTFHRAEQFVKFLSGTGAP